MVELISIIILFSSLLGMAVILWRKMPTLSKLPERNLNFSDTLTSRVKDGIQKMPVIKNFSYNLYLQKILSKFRVLSLKTESKTGSWLEKLRQKKSQKNNGTHDSYWDELKKAKNGR